MREQTRSLGDHRSCRWPRETAEFHDQYGDDVTFIPGAYFASMYNSREEVNRDIHEALAKVSDL